MKNIYLVRHCAATGQHEDSPLTNQGNQQAYALANFFSEQKIPIDRIISSPYLRAIESIKPYAHKTGLHIEIDNRLKERILSIEPIDDWYEILEYSFKHQHFKLPGGESSSDAALRILEVFQEIYLDEKHSHIAVITHGNLLSLLLNNFDKNFGFNEWKELKNPDLFVIKYHHGVQSYKHLFKSFKDIS